MQGLRRLPGLLTLFSRLSPEHDVLSGGLVDNPVSNRKAQACSNFPQKWHEKLEQTKCRPDRP